MLIILFPKFSKTTVKVGRNVEHFFESHSKEELVTKIYSKNFRDKAYYGGLIDGLYFIRSFITPEGIRGKELAGHEHKNEITSVLTDLSLLFAIVAALALVSYYGIKVYNKKKAMESERERLKSVLQEQKNLIVSKLSTSNMPPDTSDIIDDVKIIYYNTLDAIEKIDFSQYQEICREAIRKMNALSEPLIKQIELRVILTKAESAFRDDQITLKRLLENALIVGQKLNSSYDDIWEDQELIFDFLKEATNIDTIVTKIDQKLSLCRQKIETKEYSDAKEIISDITQDIAYYKTNCRIITDKELEITRALTRLESYQKGSAIENRLQELDRYIKRNEALAKGSFIKKEVKKYMEEIDGVTINLNTRNPLSEEARIQKILTRISELQSEAREIVEQFRLSHKQTQEKQSKTNSPNRIETSNTSSPHDIGSGTETALVTGLIALSEASTIEDSPTVDDTSISSSDLFSGDGASDSWQASYPG